MIDILQVLGFCFLLGGATRSEQTFNNIGEKHSCIPSEKRKRLTYNMPILAAQTSSSLLALTVLSLLVPAAFAASTPDDKVKEGILALSHGTAIVLLIIYILFLFFQVRIVTQTIVMAGV